MTETYRTTELEKAIQERDAARRIFERCEEDVAQNPGARWAALGLVQAEEELNYWQSKVAFLNNAP